MDNLTKDQKFLLSLMYKEFLSRQPALDPIEANYFEDSEKLKSLLNLNFSEDYISSLCWDLHENGYLLYHSGDLIATEIFITNKTINYFENRFSNSLEKFTELLKFIATLR